MSPHPTVIFWRADFRGPNWRFPFRWLPLLILGLLALVPSQAANLGDLGSDSSRYPSRDPFSSSGLTNNQISFVEFWILPLFFPPHPPVLGSPLPLANRMPLLTQPAPESLATFVNELFYPQLGSRVAREQLTRHVRQKLKAYNAIKQKLGDELHAELARLRTAGTPARKAAMEVFASAHAAELAALEKTAEELRTELIRGELLQPTADWDTTRDWKLGTSRFRSAEDAIAAQHQVMRAAVFYQKGLSLEQRGLLREITMEFEEVNPASTAGENRNPPLFFSPPTARLRLPGDLPTALAEKFTRYESEKSALKQELRETVYAHDRDYFSSTRLHAFEALSKRQAPQLDSLEALAEEIREDLARLPTPIGPPAAPPIPAHLAAQLAAYLDDRNTLTSDIYAKIGELKKEYSILSTVTDKTADGRDDLKLVLAPSADGAEKLKALQARLAVINREIFDRQKAILAQEKALSRAFAEAVTPPAGRSLESMISDCVEAVEQREEWAAYADYQTAMLTPGLTPQLRRILFDRGMANLSLPLPERDMKTITSLD